MCGGIAADRKVLPLFQALSVGLVLPGAMSMAADHNINFPLGGVFPQSFCNQHVVSFHSGTVNNTHGIFPGGMNISGGINGTTAMILAGNSGTLNNISPLVSTTNSPGNIPLEPQHGRKHRTSFAVDWSCEELEVMKRGLATYVASFFLLAAASRYLIVLNIFVKMILGLR